MVREGVCHRHSGGAPTRGRASIIGKKPGRRKWSFRGNNRERRVGQASRCAKETHLRQTDVHASDAIRPCILNLGEVLMPLGNLQHWGAIDANNPPRVFQTHARHSCALAAHCTDALRLSRRLQPLLNPLPQRILPARRHSVRASGRPKPWTLNT